MTNKNTQTINIKLTPEEADLINNYVFNEMCRLEDANLKDTLYYTSLTSIHRKILRANMDLEIKD